MARTKLTVENFAAEINKALDKYAEDVTLDVADVCKEVGKKGATLLKNKSNETFKARSGVRRYGSYWTYTVDESHRLKTTVTIHNLKPGLPHLLENGHAKRGGGRVAGRPHIAPVEEEVIRTVESEVERRLS